MSSSSPASSWRLTFETICLTHVGGIKRALGIEGVQTEQSAWHHRPTDTVEQGAQIDLVIDRADQSINLCEMKFSAAPFIIDKRYAGQLRAKRASFELVTRTRKALITTLVTSFGLKENIHAQALGVVAVTMDALFESAPLS